LQAEELPSRIDAATQWLGAVRPFSTFLRQRLRKTSPFG